MHTYKTCLKWISGAVGGFGYYTVKRWKEAGDDL